jgi:hypothetical protein
MQSHDGRRWLRWLVLDHLLLILLLVMVATVFGILLIGPVDHSGQRDYPLQRSIPGQS